MKKKSYICLKKSYYICGKNISYFFQKKQFPKEKGFLNLSEKLIF